MTVAKGYKAKLAAKREAGSYGTAIAVSQMLPFLSESLNKDIEKIFDESLSGVAGYNEAATVKISAGGNISCDFAYQGFEEILLIALGHQQINSVVDLGNGFYQHIVEPDVDLITRAWRTNEGWTTADGLTTADIKVRRATVVVDKQVSQHRFKSCFVNSFSLSGQAGQSIKFDAELLAFDRELAAIDTSGWVYPDGAVDGSFKRVLFNDLVFKFNGTEYAISEFSLNYNNKLGQSQSNSKYLDEAVRSGLREVTFSFKVAKYESDYFFDEFDAENEANAILVFSHPDGFRVEIFLPRLVYQKSDANVGGQDIVSQSLDFIALTPASLPAGFPGLPSGIKKEIYIRLTNQIATELWNI